MGRRRRPCFFTAIESAEIWDRWQGGEGLKLIDRVFGWGPMSAVCGRGELRPKKTARAGLVDADDPHAWLAARLQVVAPQSPTADLHFVPHPGRPEASAGFRQPPGNSFGGCELPVARSHGPGGSYNGRDFIKLQSLLGTCLFPLRCTEAEFAAWIRGCRHGSRRALHARRRRLRRQGLSLGLLRSRQRVVAGDPLGDVDNPEALLQAGFLRMSLACTQDKRRKHDHSQTGARRVRHGLVAP